MRCRAIRNQRRSTKVLSLSLHALPQVHGHGHASNLLFKPGTLRWLKGEELIKVYKVPEAKRFAPHFCPACGGQVPRYVKETDFIVVPAGSLDSEPAIKPQARIFWDSRASWSCSGDGLPVYPEYVT